ncbi:hypothetical protein AGDE_15684 [Angomonas deanei]|uniref:Amastin surface glycoprotein n=1 Tax=Angomonas deanei TaxID=59799 RepID=A0A7G2BZQ4_9TRYP|nr:hypothetical protein AGDE_15684 [Angomonas deanei]CAD2212956.1 hypothetical protein, conserved [Angomonas deanei]|eukprot:EPY18654.1 hypothetical protein AGDE_15684 [Angomonas deanei]
MPCLLRTIVIVFLLVGIASCIIATSTPVFRFSMKTTDNGDTAKFTQTILYFNTLTRTETSMDADGTVTIYEMGKNFRDQPKSCKPRMNAGGALTIVALASGILALILSILYFEQPTNWKFSAVLCTFCLLSFACLLCAFAVAVSVVAYKKGQDENGDDRFGHCYVGIESNPYRYYVEGFAFTVIGCGFFLFAAVAQIFA